MTSSQNAGGEKLGQTFATNATVHPPNAHRSAKGLRCTRCVKVPISEAREMGAISTHARAPLNERGTLARQGRA